MHLVLYARTGLVGFHADLATPGLGGAWQAAPAARRAELERLHAGPNLPMPVGIRVALDAQQRRLSLLEPAVRPVMAPGPAG